MGAGSEGAGTGGAGLDVPEAGLMPAPNPPVALRFEGLNSDWVLQPDSGDYRSVTSTEQGMILSICVNQGQIKSSTTTGNTLDQIQYLGGKNLQADVEDRLRNANPAKALIAAGKAKFVNIEVQSSGQRLLVAASFQALDAPKSQILKRTWSN
jgi:hypothetical protein